jgi:hypothetical protein
MTFSVGDWDGKPIDGLLGDKSAIRDIFVSNRE